MHNAGYTSNGRPSDEALTLLIDGATNYAIYMLDPDGRVTIWNRGAERIKGWTESEIVGKPSSLFYLPEDVAAGVPAQELTRARAQGRIEEESWRVRKDGSRFLADVTVTALYAPSGELRGFGKVVRDVTEERAAKTVLAQRESQLAAILATVPDAMVLLDAAGSIVSFSRAAERMFGHPEATMLGQPITALLEGAEATEILAAPTLPLSGRAMIGRRHDGSTFPLELALDRIEDGESAFIAFMRDIGERERTLRELQDLQGRLAQVARVSLLGAMGSTLAHELNQPITATVHYAEVLRHQLTGIGPSALIDEALAGVIDESLRAGEIVRRLRSFITRGELDRQVCDLTALIRESCSMLAGTLAEHRVAQHLDLGHQKSDVFVEPIQIQQVVSNLVRNAVEAMAQARTRRLTIASRTESGMVRISVADTGSGIPEVMMATLFDTFSSDKADGMGLGLSICRTIVEAHGGRIWATSGNGETQVNFTVPVASAP